MVVFLCHSFFSLSLDCGAKYLLSLLKLILDEQDVRMWAGFNIIRIRASGGPLNVILNLEMKYVEHMKYLDG